MKKTLKLTSLILISGIIYLSGCGSNNGTTNNATSIVGTWTETSLREIDKTNNVTTKDTTEHRPNLRYNYMSNGNFTVIYGTDTSTGQYTVSGSTLNTNSTALGISSYNIQTLTANSLVLSITLGSQNSTQYISTYTK